MTERARLALDNSIGGLTENGDYQMHVRGSFLPPAPWANVIANTYGGFTVTERGAGCTWAGNSYFYRLTPWSNDPVSDPPGEVLYLRDTDSGEACREAAFGATPPTNRSPLGFLQHRLRGHRIVPLQPSACPRLGCRWSRRRLRRQLWRQRLLTLRCLLLRRHALERRDAGNWLANPQSAIIDRTSGLKLIRNTGGLD